ncbi:MAG: uracil-DNA glycosylase family protein, partial [Hyphomicrobiales bacterium]
HKSGIPFTDPSGDRLRDWMGIGEAEFYNQNLVAILPMGFCFPGLDAHGGDLPPRRECAPLWRAEFMATFENIKLVVAVGSYALKWHLGDNCGKNLSETISCWRDHVARNPPLIALPHPSWRNNGWLKRHPVVEADIILELRRRVGAILAKG